jgi:uncharacterized protein YndB with AHSA1/START domain/DNA-binding transcriptional ArsR family regulator
MELVFRALADPTRRALLDALRDSDGQTLVALTARHQLTRVAVAKHLRLLEAAGLVVTKRRGREKFHYLNAVPIQLVHDRWVSKYTEPWAAGLLELKHEVEQSMEKVFEIYVRATPERLWAAITDPAIRAKYHFGAGVESDWAPGSTYTLGHPASDRPLAEGENLVVDPPHRLVQTMHTLWSEEAEREGTSRVTWEIEPVGDSCRLTVTHDQLRDGAPPELYGGWPMILSGLKTWLETGQTLTTPGSLMYGEPRSSGATAMPQTTITDVRTVSITVTDQDQALAFYVDTLGFEKRLDAPISPTMRWIEVAPPGGATSIALSGGQGVEPDGGIDTGIRFAVPDATAEHGAMRAAGHAGGEVMRWGGVPPN